MQYTTIEYLQEDNIGIIRLNRPYRMNAVIEEMYIEIQQALKAADCPTAREHFREAGFLDPNDQAIRDAAALADLCSGQRTTNYLVQVDALTARTIDD